ncbi:hypothetical protein HPB47_002233 [Ixodes persulcatus]|uniref:Uncharacterized protein n=1 Tax=Ixodes persulcatus TaxID=34615 RepID=A0AC60PLS9_IXOPE|nr:hypothetical protein HPB47_002233 [Ixodes persulcatus]
MRTLTAHDRAVDVVAHEAMTGDTIRGVAHGINPEDTSETLLRALRSNSHAIINARPLGKNGLALVTFQGHRPPRTIFYYDVIINVTPYSPTTVVCRRCHGLGHKEHACTRPPRCPDCGCIVSNDHVCERTYCANCRVTTHLATDPKCPVKRKTTAEGAKPDVPPPAHHDPEADPELKTLKPLSVTTMNMLKTGYFTDCNSEAQAWREELRSISEAEKAASETLLQLEEEAKKFELRKAGSAIYSVAVSSSIINPEAPSYVAVEGDLEAASPAEAVLVAFCLLFIFSYD